MNTIKNTQKFNSNHQKLFKVYNDPQVNKFFWYATISGGILKTNKVDRIIKKIWIGYNLSSILTMFIINVICCLCYEEKTLATLLKMHRPLFAILGIFINAKFLSRQQKLVEKYTDTLDQHFDKFPSNDDNSKFSTTNGTCAILLLVYPLISTISAPLVRYYFSDFTILEEFYNFHYPYKIDSQNNLTAISAIIVALQTLSMVQICIAAFSMLQLIELYTSISRRAANHWRKQFQVVSPLTLQQLESSHNQELLLEQLDSEERNKSAERFIQQRNKIADNFEQEMIYIAKQLWKLSRIHLHLSPLFENSAALGLVILYAIQISLTSHLMWIIDHPSQLTFQTIQACIVFLTNLCILYSLCKMGEKTIETFESFPIEVYSTPWHMLPVKHRKTLYIFLTQTQYTCRLRILNTFPMDMTFFNRFYNSVRSQASVLQQFLPKSV